MTGARTVIAKRKCGCGRLLTPHANGTIPRHTRPGESVGRVRCSHVGELFAAIAKARGKTSVSRPAGRTRGGRRAAKRDMKNAYKRNSAGGYNGRVGSAGSR